MGSFTSLSTCFGRSTPETVPRSLGVVIIDACDRHYTQHLDYRTEWSRGELSPSGTCHKIKTEHIFVTCPLVPALSQTVCDVDESPVTVLP